MFSVSSLKRDVEIHASSFRRHAYFPQELAISREARANLRFRVQRPRALDECPAARYLVRVLLLVRSRRKTCWTSISSSNTGRHRSAARGALIAHLALRSSLPQMRITTPVPPSRGIAHQAHMALGWPRMAGPKACQREVFLSWLPVRSSSTHQQV